jgi:hypothetical protein
MGNALLEALGQANRISANALLRPRGEFKYRTLEEAGIPTARQFAESASMTGVPVVSDLASAGLAVSDYLKGDYGSAAMNAVGVLPFIGGAGMIKGAGNLPKNSLYPKGYEDKIIRGHNVMPSSETWDSAGMLRGDMNAIVRPMNDGDYMVRYSPGWGGKNKPFYAIGDDPEELAGYALDRIGRSDKAISAAAKKKEDASLLGRLKAEYGDAFSLGKSTQSKSEYITHAPSGIKIRISDHDLPLGYEQPDVDLRIGSSVDQMMDAIRKAIGQ